MITHTAEGTFVTLTCGECGIRFGVPKEFNDENLRNGGGWHCPNGHSRVYRESETKKLERQLAREKSQHDQTKANLRDTRGSLITEKGHRTRLKKSVADGMCPCCRRSFQNLKRHMDNQHPEYTDKKKNKRGLKAIK